MANERWRGRTAEERATYDHYVSGSTRGDLFVHVKRGREGVMKPPRSHENAFAAWMAGHDLEKQDTPNAS